MILMVCATFPPEPVVAASITYDLAKALSETNKVRVLTPRPSRPFGFSFKHDTSKAEKFEQIILQSYTYAKSSLWGRSRESYSFGKYVSRYIRQYWAEISFIYICSWPLLSNYKIVKTAKKFSIPSVLHIEDIYPEALASKLPVCNKLIQRLLLPMDVFALTNASKVISVSENMSHCFMTTRGIAEDKIALVQNWQDESEFVKYQESKEAIQTYGQKNEIFTFMYLGNIGPVAGVEFIIKSFAQAGLNGARLVIAGSGSSRKECKELASRFSNVKIEFWCVPAGKVPEIQDQADVMLLPVKCGASLSSIPSKLIAYLFSKKPVIACVEDNSDTAFAIKKANCGWVVPPENTHNLVETLKTVVAIPQDDLMKYGIRGYNYADENFSKKRNLKKLVRLITDLYGEQREHKKRQYEMSMIR